MERNQAQYPLRKKAEYKDLYAWKTVIQLRLTSLSHKVKNITL